MIERKEIKSITRILRIGLRMMRAKRKEERASREEREELDSAIFSSFIPRRGPVIRALGVRCCFLGHFPKPFIFIRVNGFQNLSLDIRSPHFLSFHSKGESHSSFCDSESHCPPHHLWFTRIPFARKNGWRRRKSRVKGRKQKKESQDREERERERERCFGTTVLEDTVVGVFSNTQ